ncbi:GGDEF domain-containing protein [Sphingomicrobium astaxanthinifaciens]|uniref:GGDEF domain-containing protein n=1 Tax=Sphingomicrobium astaxanthinifaciens TaxID=1227949 RepID=UPI001FCA6D8B|nr:GGDEF domain-containing protein [Sphingomicrobium astaxanthinifaciens]MCJ7420664.1 GGDEF domain-containing protein [Sphingomicrobium astaxanthinifaciens]
MTMRALGSLKINVAALALAAAVATAVHYGPLLGLAILARVAALLTNYVLGVKLRAALEAGDDYQKPMARWVRGAALAGFSWSLLLWAVPASEVGSLGAQGLFSIVLLGVASAINTVIGERRAILYFTIPFALSAGAYFVCLAPLVGWLPLLIATLGIVIIFLFALNLESQHQHLAASFAANAMLAQSLHQANVELSEALEIADRLAHYDQLTGLRNRRCFEQEAQGMASARAEDGRRLDMLLVDVDHFKSLNDRFGHAFGDRVLKRVGKALDAFAEAHPETIAARIGGEEFAVVLDGAGSDAEARLYSEDLRARIEAASPTARGSDQPSRITVSLGLTRWRVGETLDQAMRRADRLLYAAKEAGRDRSCNDFDGKAPARVADR